MSKASEWARRAVQVDAVQPRFECSAIGYQWFGYDPDPDEDGKQEPEHKVCVAGIVNKRGLLVLMSRTLNAGDACAFARWILDTFGNRETFPAEGQP